MRAKVQYDSLAGIAEPPLFSWDELAAWRWGPAIDDPEATNIINDHPDVARTVATLAAAAEEDQ